MNIILFYQHISREYGSLLQIKEELQKISAVECAVRIRSIDFEWNQACREARKYGVDVVVVPWLYVDINYALLVPFFDVNQNLKVINLHQEQLSSPGSEIILAPKGEYQRNGCFHFSWGEYYRSRLLESGVHDELIYVVGNARLDELAQVPEPGLRSRLAMEYGLDSNKKWVLFAESRGWVYKATDSYRRETLNMGISEAAYDTGLEIEKESLRLFLEQLNALPDSFFEDHEFIYRAHPGTSAGENVDSRARVISALPIGTWLKAIDVMVMWNSTSAFEAEMCGVPVLRHEPVDNPAWHRVCGLDAFSLIQDLAEIPDALDGCNQPFAAYEFYFGPFDGKRSRAVAHKIVEIAHGEMTHERGFRLSTNLKKQIQGKRLFELSSRLTCRVGLLERIKWPKSAYYEINDIPYYRKNNSSQG